MKFDWKRDLRRLLLVIVASAIIAVNLKMFVRPAEMYPGGMNGLSMLMQTIFSTYLGVQVPFTVFNVIFNSIPVYIGLRFLGRKFTILSIITIILSSVLTDLLPDLGPDAGPAAQLRVRRHTLRLWQQASACAPTPPPAARTSSPCTWPEARPRRLWHHLHLQRHHAGRGGLPLWLGQGHVFHHLSVHGHAGAARVLQKLSKAHAVHHH